jgi:RNA ligase (TIGR02306 family)
MNKIYTIEDFPEGIDVSALLNITHYEPPLPQDLSAKGLLPLGIPKTDEERWENMVARLPFGEVVDVTLKVDGQSWSAYYDLEKDQFGVLGRTMEYKEECHNRYTAQLDRYDIKNKLIDYCKQTGMSICIRGESYGDGLQAHSFNPHAKEKAGLAIFSVWLIKERRYARKGDPFYFPIVATQLGIPHVEILEKDVVLTKELIQKYSAELKKVNGVPFEGVVINHGPYTLEREVQTILCPDGITREVGGTTQFTAGSLKVISKNYDMNK